MKTYEVDQEIAYYKIRISKEESAFFYFTLEACDNLCFYSTLEHETGQAYRDIEVRTTIEFQENMGQLFSKLAQSIEFEIIQKEIRSDN